MRALGTKHCQHRVRPSILRFITSTFRALHRNLSTQFEAVATLCCKPPAFISEFIVQVTEKKSFETSIPCAARVTRRELTRRRDASSPMFWSVFIRDSNCTVFVSCLQLVFCLGLGFRVRVCPRPCSSTSRGPKLSTHRYKGTSCSFNRMCVAKRLGCLRRHTCSKTW